MQNVQKVLAIWSNPKAKQCSSQTNTEMRVHGRAGVFFKYTSAGSPIGAALQKSEVVCLVVKSSLWEKYWNISKADS